MPIRMTDDDPNDSDQDDSGPPSPRLPRGGGGGGGGGPLGTILSLLSLLWFVVRYPKIAAGVFVVIVLLVIFGGGEEKGTDPGKTPPAAADARAPDGKAPRFGTGAVLDQKVYDKTLVHEPLAESPMPQRVSLLEFAPPRGDQGAQGSCVGWATSYAARTILFARQTGEPAAGHEFSPSFTYNQVAMKGCDGTYISRALEVLKERGDLPLQQFAYDQRHCSHLPSGPEKEGAKEYRIAGYTRLTVDGDDYRNNAVAIKQHLAQGAPVVIGMQVGGTFQTAMRGQRVWRPTADDFQHRGAHWGGHAMAIIGYDDTLEGGAFQLMNSWGREWGDGGVAFVRYQDFDKFVDEAYGLYPMGDAAAEKPLQRIRFGLVDNGTKRHLKLKGQGGTTFRTAAPIKVGTRFKVELSNTKPVYAYLFGQETDGTSYVLFPYTPKHSPYCGTTGTRIFPRKQSLTADDKGTRDSVAVVLSPKSIDVQALNKRITAAAGGSYGEKLQAALQAEFGEQLGTGAKVRAVNDLVELVAEGEEVGKLQSLVLEFDKR